MIHLYILLFISDCMLCALGFVFLILAIPFTKYSSRNFVNKLNKMENNNINTNQFHIMKTQHFAFS